MEKRYFTLLFTRPIKLPITSKVIMWRLGTQYSHVCGVVSTGPIGLFDVYEASGLKGVRDIDLDQFLKKNKVVATCRIAFDDKEKYYELIRYLKKQRGKDYSEWGAIASTFKFLRKLGVGKDGDAEFMCSEYMARGLEESKAFTFKREFTDYVDPKLFEQELLKKGFEIFCGFHLPEYGGES